MKIRKTMAGWLLLPLLALSACCTGGGAGQAGETSVSELRCRDRIDPEGVDRPVLSWKIESGERGVVQTAWEIEIASSEKALRRGEADVWKSGKRLSDAQLNIVPDGADFRYGDPYWWRVRVWDGQDKATDWSAPAKFSVGPSDADWQGKWITAEWGQDTPMPCFRTVFDAKSKPVRAVAYFSGLGCGDLYINGALADETRVLDPAQTNYEQYALYGTYDVTDRVKKGENCIGVMLGDGWYDQGKVWGPGFSYGEPLMRLQLEIVYKDGSKQIVATDESWTWAPGPVLSANIYAGETYDASREIAGWSAPGTPQGDWRPAVEATGIVPLSLRPQLVDPIRFKESVAPVDLWQDADGNWIFDFGVNIAAVPRITVDQPAGTRLRMRMGECLKADRSVEYNTTGNEATGVIQTDEYICAGRGTETWTPRFTYHGFRYLELSGAATTPDKSWIEAVIVHTDAPRRGTFECADAQINRLHEMAVRTMRGNIHGLPTDCPHRERCGWLGDAHTVAPFENFNYDLNNFWMKYMEDIHSSSSVFLENTLHQKLYNSEFYFADKQPGIPFMISPGRRLCGVASPDWGTAVVQLPWFTYLYFGNPEALETYYGEMKQWVDHIHALTDKGIVPYGLGDWCPPEGNHTIDCPIPLSSTAFHYYDASIVADAARVLGYEEDAARYDAMKSEIAEAFVKTFYDRNDKTFGSQTADAMALDFGLVPAGDEKAVSDAIVRNMKEKYDGFLHTGIFGLGRIGQALSRYGNARAAWDMFTKKGENSFEWMWTSGDATTLWEVLPVNEASKALCLKGSSLNHPMQGGYDAWFYEDVAGIRPDASAPGFRATRFEPLLTECLPWASASVETPYGTVSSRWERQDDVLQWTISIPANAWGLVALPEAGTVTVNGESFDAARYPEAGRDAVDPLYRFPSGCYTIEIR